MGAPAEMILWPPSPAQLQLEPDDVHVWAATLQISPERLADFAAMLSGDEKERAAKFKFERHRHRFVAGRGQLREILGRYTSVKPVSLNFGYSPHGKPFLETPGEQGV